MLRFGTLRTSASYALRGAPGGRLCRFHLLRPGSIGDRFLEVQHGTSPTLTAGPDPTRCGLRALAVGARDTRPRGPRETPVSTCKDARKRNGPSSRQSVRGRVSPRQPGGQRTPLAREEASQVPSTKRSHSVSRFYLQAWACEPGLVYRFDKGTRRWEKRSLKKQAGVVRDAYTQGAEDWLATAVETPVAPIIEQLRTAATRTELVLDMDDRFRVAAFMVETNFYNVAARRRVAAMMGEMRSDSEGTKSERRLMEAARKEILKDPEQVRSPLVRDARGHRVSMRLYESIAHGQWSIYYTTDTDARRNLVTTDDPVMRLPATITEDYGPVPQGPLDHFLMPLSPKRLLVCRRRSGRLFERLTEPIADHPDADIVIRMYGLTNRQINYTNLLMASTAWKHVFAARPVPKIERWDSENFETQPRYFPDARGQP